MEDVHKKSKSPSPKGEKPSEPAQLKRSASADGASAPKKRKVGLAMPKPYPDVADPEVDIDAHKPIKERLRNSPGRVTPPKPPAKGKGKGKGKGRGKAQGDQPDVARAPDNFPSDQPAATTDEDEPGEDAVPDPNPSGNDEEANEDDEIKEE